jgi:hypothetical protein
VTRQQVLIEAETLLREIAVLIRITDGRSEAILPFGSEEVFVNQAGGVGVER